MKRWIVKALVQKTLAATPGGHWANFKLQGLRGDRSAEARSRAPGLLSFMSRVDRHFPILNARVLELGTGWGAINALLLSLLGAKAVIATDHVAHLRPQTVSATLKGLLARADAVARQAGQDAQAVATRIEDILVGRTLPIMLDRARIEYRAPFDASRTELPADSVDIIYSYAVLAHVPESALSDVAGELARIAKPGGISAHWIGLQDPFNHLNGRGNLNFLRFDERVWSFLSHNSIQYNNRLRAPDYAKLFSGSGGEILVDERQINEEDLKFLRQTKVDRRFQGLNENDLAAIGQCLICRY